MKTIRDLREGHEELNLPYDTCLDTPIYREAFRDLKKTRTGRLVTYEMFLRRMKERNINSRKKEFDRRRLLADWSTKDVEFVSA